MDKYLYRVNIPLPTSSIVYLKFFSFLVFILLGCGLYAWDVGTDASFTKEMKGELDGCES